MSLTRLLQKEDAESGSLRGRDVTTSKQVGVDVSHPFPPVSIFRDKNRSILHSSFIKKKVNMKLCANEVIMRRIRRKCVQQLIGLKRPLSKLSDV